MNRTGQFQKGVSGNPAGRKPRAVEDRYLAITFASVSEEDWIAVIEAQIAQAKKGNVKSAEFLANYVLGKPIQRIETTGKDGGAIETKQGITLNGLSDADIDGLLAKIGSLSGLIGSAAK